MRIWVGDVRCSTLAGGVWLREVSDKRNAMDRGVPITVFVAGADRPMAVTGFIQAVVIDNVANDFDITILEE